jgi:hypothetical protein
MLAKGSDIALSPIAKEELDATDNSSALVDVADRWGALNKDLSSAERRAVEHHVLDVLVRALPAAAGLARTRVIDGIHKVQRSHEVWLDLHAATVPARDAKRGEWLRDENGNIAGSIATGTGSLSTLINPQGSYEFTCEFTRLGPAGDIAFFVPVEDRMCVVSLAGYNNSVSWIDAVDGHGNSGKNPTLVSPPGIASGVRHALHVTVRAKGNAVQLLVRLNGKDYMGYRGNLARLGKVNFGDAANDPHLLGLGMWQTHVLFHTLKYRAIK